MDALSRRSDFLENILQTCPEGIIANDNAGNIFLYNASAERIFGYPPQDVIGKMDASRLYPPGGAREVREYLYSEKYGGRGRLVDFETEVVRSDGKLVPIRLCCAPVMEGNREAGMIGFFTDITERKAMLNRFLESEERFRGIFESAYDAIVSIGKDGKVLMANGAAHELLAYPAGGLAGVEASGLFPPRFEGYWKELVLYASRMAEDRAHKSIEITVLPRTGAEKPVQMTLAEKDNRNGKTLTAVLRDISDRKALEEELRIQAITDALTELYNRRHFLTLAQNEVERWRRTRAAFSILLVDVDHFKRYNDRFGHAEGDKVLKALGDEIRNGFRTMDTGFRYGGEEFLVLLPETDGASALHPAERLRTRFSRREFLPDPEGRPRRVTLSIGIAEYREGDSIDDMVRSADRAMYAAKNGGRNRVAGIPETPAENADPRN